jgi:rhodanese-related sulfurtransferase
MQSAATEITREELAARRSSGSILLVDVLPAESYRTEHIPGAVSLPLAEIETRASQVLPDRGAEIAVYCGSFT